MTDLRHQKMLILVVLYQTEMRNSVTLQSLIGQDSGTTETNVVIWDNSYISVKDNDIIKCIEDLYGDVQFIHCPSNMPLSVLYNKVVTSNDANIYIILDQDSKLSPTFLHSIIEATRAAPEISLFVPKVVADGLLVSPGRFGSFKGNLLQRISTGPCCSDGMTVITSGMAVRSRVFDSENMLFNERLWLYAIDTDFFLKFRDKFNEFWVIDETIGHSSALREKMTLEARLFRFKNLRWSYLEMFKARKKLIIPLIYMVYLSSKHSIQFKSMRFMTGWSDSGRKNP